MFSSYTSENKRHPDGFFFNPAFNMKENSQCRTESFYKLCRPGSFFKPAGKYARKWSTLMVLHWTQLPHLVFNLQLAAEPVGCFRNKLATLMVDLNVCMNRNKRQRKLILLLWRPTTTFLVFTWIKLLITFHPIPKKINSVIWTN